MYAIRSYYVYIMKLHNKKHSSYIASAVQYISLYYKEEISLNTMAEHIGISSVYLSNIFKKETGMNFVSYLTKYRLDKGKEMLLETSLSVKNSYNFV